MSRSGFANWLQQKLLPAQGRLADMDARTEALESRFADWSYANLYRVWLWPDRTQVEYYRPGGVSAGTGLLDVAPRIVGGRTMVPLRFVGEVLGAAVNWEEESRRVTYDAGGRQIILTMEETAVLVDGQAAEMDTAPLIIDGRTMVPVRFVSQWLGAAVKWEGSLNRVEIIYRDTAPDISLG